ncbi:MAG: phosphate ABC transporter permease PstA [Campylobacteraceae bacterium]|jgi:phosphate transport system permease protein|nr:phosphate ABC transporter permease PstA [Campylobacteraceae bacterium]
MLHKNRRKIANTVILALSTIAAVAGIAILFWILGVLLIKGFSYISLATFTQDGTPPGMEGGGLRQALVGHLLLTGVAMGIGIPVGMLAGTYLSEYGQGSKVANFVRDLSDIMMSAPSIVVGVFVYGIMVAPVHHFSGWAGSVALAILAIPVIIRTTDDMLRLVPQTLREAAYALGAPKWKVIFQVVYKGAAVGLMTGILLGVARVAGETAPLLFTSFNNNFFSLNMNDSMASLTVTMFGYASSPYEDWQRLGWAGAAILTFAVLFINIISRIIMKLKKGQR